MAYLSLKLDHFAVLRQARRGRSPQPAQAAVMAELAGVDGVTVHMRNDRRHIREKDLFILREMVLTRLTVEISPNEENLNRVLEVKPYMVTFIPEVDREITTQSGMALSDVDSEMISEMAYRLKEMGIKCAVHVEPDADIIKKASKIGVDAVKLHTGLYAAARTEEEGLAELGKIERAANAATKSNMVVMAGQGLDYQNLGPLVKMGVIDEFVIGQAIIARSALVGLERAVQDILRILGNETVRASS